MALDSFVELLYCKVILVPFICLKQYVTLLVINTLPFGCSLMLAAGCAARSTGLYFEREERWSLLSSAKKEVGSRVFCGCKGRAREVNSLKEETRIMVSTRECHCS